MSFAYSQVEQINIGDSIDLVAYLYLNRQQTDDETLVPAAQISEVQFVIQRPQDPAGTYITIGGTVPSDGTATGTVPATEHDTAGVYVAKAVFTWGPTTPFNQKTSSVMCTYNVIDPFETSGAMPYDPSVDDAWNRLADLFDSEEGGPWMRDYTKSRFDKTRIRQFVGQVFFDINETPPQVNVTDPTSFNYAADDGQALVSQGLLVYTIRHLIRTYVEQPETMNSPVGFMERRSYMDRWQSVLQFEEQLYKRMLAQYKMRQFAGVSGKLLVSSKAGRNMIGALRQRGVWRGIY